MMLIVFSRERGIILKKILCLLVFVSVISTGAGITTSVQADPMTKEQGDGILKELKEIRLLLEKQQRPAVSQPQQPPKPDKVKVKGGGAYTMGKSDAPLVLVEYTDYQCPFCSRFEAQTFSEIKKNLIDTGKVRFIQRDLPLEFHQFALKAAQAVRCAGEQGKFWEMKDLLFKNQAKLEAEAIAGYANGISLNADKFKSCMAGDKYLKEITEEAKYANSIGISGTPTFVLGKISGDSVEGYKIIGAQPYPAFEAVVNELLGPGGKK